LGWPLWLQRSAIVVLLFTFTLASWRIWVYRQQRATQIALELTPIALVPDLREESPIPSTPPPPYKPLPTGSDQPVTEIDPLTRDTDLYLHPVIGAAKLIHLATKREYPLIERLKIGQAQESDIQLEGSGVDLHHAEVYWQTTQYVLVNLSKVYSTQLNSQPVTIKPLSDSDRILIGDHTLVFKFQEL